MGEGAILAMDIVFGLLDRASSITALIKTAQSEGRDITAEELDALVSADDASRVALVEAIAKRKQQP